MNALFISWKSIWSKPLSSALSILLIAFGIGILSILLLASHQIDEKLNKNSKDIDLVVGAKGSPMQLILSSIYYIDFPTGNIPYKEAYAIMKNPFVKRAVPLALGDNYNGVRIVGTDTNFVSLYELEIAQGSLWSKDLEVSVGATVAREQNLKVGDTFHGAHGLTTQKDKHDHAAFTVAGILKESGNVTDNLILTNVSSVWNMHGDHEEAEEEHDHSDPNHVHEEKEIDYSDKELTSILIQYRSPMSVVMFPAMVNATTNMQSASPAMESTRLFSLVGVGVETLQWFAYLVMFIAAISVFVNLYNSLKERSYDLAIMRTLGASRAKLFLIVILEGLILAVIGTIIGLALGHGAIELIGDMQKQSQARLSGLIFVKNEIYLIFAGLGIGILASMLPSIQAYRANISKILGKN